MEQDSGSKIICGCGFSVVGSDNELNFRTFQEHDCPNAPIVEDREPMWHESFAKVFITLFMWTAIAVIAALLFGYIVE